MKRIHALLLAVLLLCCGCAEAPGEQPGASVSALDSGPVEAGLIVNKAENLPDDFIMGADVSSLIALENSGVKYYGFDGQEQDALLTLRQAGVNYIRIRLWNDPYDANGNGYGGGDCDLAAALAIGRRAATYGLPILIDFHMSDFWADPSKQQAPKAWAALSYDEICLAMTQYVTETLSALRDGGVNVGMVQIGNETTNAFCGQSDWPKLYGLLGVGCAAVRAFDPAIRIAVHFTNPERGKYANTAFLLEHYAVDYDVFASSYYPFWHGTTENLTRELSAIAETYHKQVMVAETSWAYTLSDFDGHANTIGEALTYEKPYLFTVQGQADAISDVVHAVTTVGEAGIGVFYWEPAWLPVPADTEAERKALWETYGSGWASSYASEYDPADAGVYYGGCACENQALFDSTGHPLESLKTFAYLRTGTVCPVKTDAVEPVYLTVRCNNPITLPETVTAVNNDGTKKEIPVEWEETALAVVPSDTVGVYSVPGTAEGLPVTAYVSMVEENYLENYSFEDADTSVWQVENLAPGTQTDFQVKKTDAYEGETSLHFWNADAVEWRVSQTVTGLKPGNYRVSLQAQGGDIGDGAELYLFAVADGVTYTAPFTLSGWAQWTQPVIDNIPCRNGEITVGAYVRCAGGGWGTLDAFMLNPAAEPVAAVDDKYRNWYEVFVYSFSDSDGDGHGDLNGVRSKLDYIASLGCNGVWLMPVMPSPSYHKYDVTDYYGIDPLYGTLEDFSALMTAAHARGIRVIIDLPINHTSDKHPWFVSAKADAASPYRSRYRFSDTPQTGYSGGNGLYYESRFVDTMPDLNLDSPQVREEIQNILRFWLELGVDGFRLDAVTSYYTGSADKNVAFLSWLGDTAHAIDPNCYLVGEAWSDLATIKKYAAARIDSVFLFPTAQHTGYLAKLLSPTAKEPGAGYGRMTALFETELPTDTIPAPFLSNHDMARTGSFIGTRDPARLKVAAGMLLMMRGSVFLYYGEEIGMKGSGEDPNKRIGMLWTTSDAVTLPPPGATVTDYALPSVAAQQKDAASLLSYYKNALALRNSNPEIARGVSEVLPCDNPTCCMIRRTYEGESVLIALNLGRTPATLTLDSDALRYTALSGTLTADGEAATLTSEGNSADALYLPAYSIAILR